MRLPGLMLVLLLSACGCKNGDKSGGTLGNGNGQGPAPTAADCDGLRDRLITLYGQAAPAPPDETPEAGKLREQEARDNADMVVADCRRDPARIVPCVRRAADARQIEQGCVLPLDDEGNAEQRQFGQ